MSYFKYLYFFLLQLYPIFATFKESCQPKSEVIAELENRYKIRFNRPSVSFIYDAGNVYVNDYSVNKTELKLLTANVIFSGEIKTKGKNQNNASSFNFNTKSITIQRIQESLNGEMNWNCKLTFSDNYDLSIDVSPEVEEAVIQLTEQCLQTHLCRSLDSILSYNFLLKQKIEIESNINTSLQPTEKPRDTRQNTISDPKSVTSCELQETINAMADFAINVLINNFAADNNGTVHIPVIYQNFSTGKYFWTTTGEVTTSSGTFKGLTTLERISDVVFDNDDLNFSVATTYRLAKAEIKFDYYKVRYGIIKIDGKILGQIKGLTLAAKISADYNTTPCQIILDKFNLEELEDLDLDMTGLGILNSPASSIISYIIKNKTFDKVKEAIKDILQSLDCEKFRPKNS